MKFLHEWIDKTIKGLDVEGTKKTYGRALQAFWKWYEANGQPDLSVNVLHDYRIDMRAYGYSTSTVQISGMAIKMAIDLNARPTTVDERLDLMDIKRIKYKKGKPDSYAITLTNEEREAIFATCDIETFKGTRDLAMLTMIFFMGMRRSEVVGLEMRDYDAAHGVLYIREAKGAKDRALPLHPIVIQRIDAWLKYRPYVARCDALFVGLHKSNGQKMSGNNLYSLMIDACKRAGIAHYHPHDARSTFITNLHDNGVAVADIQELAGHSNPSTTISYVRVNFRNLKKAVLTLD